MQNVLAGMAELSRSRGHNNAYVNAYTVQNLYYDFRAQEAGRNVDTTPQLIPSETCTPVGKVRHLELTSKRDVPPADEDGEPQLTEPRLESLRSQKKTTANTTRIHQAGEEHIQSDPGETDFHFPSLKWKMRHPGGSRCPYELDCGFRILTEADYENMPDPTTELGSDSLSLLRQGFLTFYDLPLNMLKEITDAKLKNFGRKKQNKCGIVSEVSYT